MALRAPSWVSDVLRWRWLPTVALVLASLLYVLFALAFVPTDIRFSAASPSASAFPGAVGLPLAASGTDEVGPGDPAEDGTLRRRRRTRRRAEATEAQGAEAAPAAEEAAPPE